jgi:hypothetical protein
MRKPAYLLATALGLVLTASQAQAAVIVYNPTAQVDVSVIAHQGPHVQGSAVSNVNGVQTNHSVGPGGSASSSGGPHAVAGDAYIPGGAGDRSFTATAHGASDLASGTLKAWVATTGDENFGTPGGDVAARIMDTIYFTNTTDGDLALDLSWAFEGVFDSPTDHVSSSGTSGLYVSGCGSCGAVRFAGDGTGIGDVASASFNDHGLYRINTFGGDLPLYGSGAHWTTQANGVGGARISTTLLIPTGESVMGLHAFLTLSCRAADTCDYGHTGTFSFGDLADGLSFTSASGAFLTAPTGEVPEPGAWALMILGFGMTGGLLRRRRLEPAA